MRFNEGADLDTSQVQDLRGSRGGFGGGGLGGIGLGRGAAVGGGGLGVVGLLLFVLLTQLGGGGGGGTGFGGLAGVQPGQQVDNGRLAQECRTGADANTNEDCRTVAVINSIQAYWTDEFARSGTTYQPAVTNFFAGGVSTGGCGSASSAAGPFYCPADAEVYIDLTFFDELRGRFGAEGGPFAEAYVLAHEYGHHVQNLLGTSSRVGRETGPESGAVRLELQADCYAGVWGNHATTVPTASGEPLIVELTQQDIASALDTAGRIGDDYIQTQLGGGQVDESQFSHGTSEQRQRWFTTGFETGDPAQCDTFAAPTLG